MATNNIPSRNPGFENSLQGLLKLAFFKFFSRIDGVLPAIVQSYAPGNPSTVSVLPAIQTITTNEDIISKAVLPSVPVWRLGNSDYSIDFPLKKGDVGLLVANDRDISAFIRSANESAPQTNRLKSFSDAFFFPMPLKGHASTTEGLSIQKSDQGVQVLLTEDSVKIKSGSAVVTLQGGQVTIDGAVQINGGEVTISPDSRVLIDGDLAVSGNITAGGNITPNTPP